MPHGPSFLHDLAIVMIVAGAVTLLFRRLKLPVVLGYLMAGLIIGPYTPPFELVRDAHAIETLAEIGLVFLMFSLGLELSLAKLREVGAAAFIAAIFEILLMLWLGYQIGIAFGWSPMDSVFLGAMLSISSTAIIIRSLQELDRLKEPSSQLIFGVLVVEDILGIAMIALLSGFALTGGLDATQGALTVARLGIFMAVTVVLGLLAVPRLLSWVVRFESREALLVVVLALCFGVSLAALEMGYSVALGAFLIGAVMSQSREIGRVEEVTESVRDMFSAVFFVAIGMLIDPRALVEYAWPIALISAVVVFGKIVSCTFGAFVAGRDLRTSVRVGMGLAQIGEFSFVIATLGMTLEVTSSFLAPIAVAVSAITTLATPFLVRGSDRVADWLHEHAPPRLMATLDEYTRWVGALSVEDQNERAGRLMRRLLWQLGLNSALVSGVYLAGAWVMGHPPEWLVSLTGRGLGLGTLMWLACAFVALLVVLPMLRQLHALGSLLGDMSVARSEAGTNTDFLRAIIAAVVPLAGTLLIGLLLLLLSSPFLSSWKPLLLLGAIVLVAAALSWRGVLEIYEKAEVALAEALDAPPKHAEPPPRPDEEPLGPAGVQLLRVELQPEHRAVGVRIRELRLRTITGASIAGLERMAEPLVQPEHDEELQAGDGVLLIGTKEQIERARSLLLEREDPDGSRI